VIGLMVIAGTANYSPNPPNEQVTYDNTKPAPIAKAGERGAFGAQVKIYIIEPVSRYDNYDDDPYHYGFLDFALDTHVSLGYQETLQQTIHWDGPSNGFPDTSLSEDNIFAIVAMFEDSATWAYADPPGGAGFWAHFSVASAFADPYSSYPDTAYDQFTHTLIGEEVTATWCPYCPAMAEALNTIYREGRYPFAFVALITDVNSQAMARKNELHSVGYPSVFFDGGDEVVVGGYSNPSDYYDEIEGALAREVPDIDLSLDMTWLGNGAIDLDLTIYCNELVNAEPYIPEAPDGPTDGCVTLEYEYRVSTTDYEGDPIYFQFHWGENPDDTTEWFGPYDDDSICTAGNIWDTEGTYDVTVRAKDIHEGNISDWSAPTSILIHPYMAGDANGDFMVNILDVVFIIDYLYNTGPMPDPYYSGDANGNGIVNIIDISYLIDYLYNQGPAPVYYQP
jgi:thiol-disulfide isomerase/thioredoxin